MRNSRLAISVISNALRQGSIARSLGSTCVVLTLLPAATWADESAASPVSAAFNGREPLAIGLDAAMSSRRAQYAKAICPGVESAIAEVRSSGDILGPPTIQAVVAWRQQRGTSAHAGACPNI